MRDGKERYFPFSLGGGESRDSHLGARAAEATPRAIAVGHRSWLTAFTTPGRLASSTASGQEQSAMDGYTHIKADEAWIRLSDVIWEVSCVPLHRYTGTPADSSAVVQAAQSMADQRRKDPRIRRGPRR